MRDQQKELTEAVTSIMAYYRKDVSEPMLRVWLVALKDYDVTQVKIALNGHVTDPDRGQFPPHVSDVVRYMQGGTVDRAQIAWSTALETAARIGAYRDVVFDDPAIHAAIHDIGGWPVLGRTSIEELGYLQMRFTNAYKTYANRKGYPYPQVLTGDRDPDSVYVKYGLRPPCPVVMGDPKLCLKVMEGRFWSRRNEVVVHIDEAMDARRLEAH